MINVENVRMSQAVDYTQLATMHNAHKYRNYFINESLTVGQLFGVY